MKIVVTGMPDPYVIKANKAEGRLKDKTVSRVQQNVRVVRVDELLELCEKQPGLQLQALANQIKGGEFE